MAKNNYVCKEPTCRADISEKIGIETVTKRVFTKDGYSGQEYSQIKRFFCPVCGTTVRSKLGEEIRSKLTMEG